MATRASVALDPMHCIHTKNGHFTPETLTQARDVDLMLDSFFAKPSPVMVIHFHGGLVSREVGAGIAAKLTPFYEAAGAYPVFFVWESGAIETIANNLKDIAKDRVFHELVRKVLQFALGTVTGAVDGKGFAPQPVDVAEISQTVDAWFGGNTDVVPYEDLQPTTALVGAKGIEFEWSAAHIEADLVNDIRFQTALSSENAAALISPDAQALIGEPGEAATKGLVSTAKLALVLAGVVKRVVTRCIARRDHGLFTTVLEEVYRGLYCDKIGQSLLWHQMKKDTVDAFSMSGDHKYPAGGTCFLTRLAEHIKAATSAPRIVLVGHSTGGNYICSFLEAADQILPSGVAFEIVLLAPAIKIKPFMETVTAHASRIVDGHMRLFGMGDSLESEDAMAKGCIKPESLARMIYPRSLLYFVSGLLEESEADAPILGMQRFFAKTDVFGEDVHPELAAARTYFDGKMVWSIANHGLGRRSTSSSHGGFDDDPDTLTSLREILQMGF